MTGVSSDTVCAEVSTWPRVASPTSREARFTESPNTSLSRWITGPE
jgi:hypothetical protein